MVEFEETNKRISETLMGSTELEYFYYLNNIDTLKMTYLEQLL